MYKRLTLTELYNINTRFFTHLHELYTRKKYATFRKFMREVMSSSDYVYFFKRGNPLLRIQFNPDDNTYRFVDEEDKIELLTDEKGVSDIHNFLKSKHNLKRTKDKNTIIENLFSKLTQENIAKIKELPFLTYDIETSYDVSTMKYDHFEMAYSISTNELGPDGVEDPDSRRYVDRSNMKEYCDYLLAYPGRIIGYNQIGFDNPVLIENVGYGKDELDILNKKSIDPFLFLRKLLKKRLSLSKVAGSLVSSGKTLDSGAEGARLLKEYKQTKDKKILKIVKEYCKQDVRITLGVILYLVEHLKVHIEGDTKQFTLEDIITRGSLTTSKESKDVISSGLF